MLKSGLGTITCFIVIFMFWWLIYGKLGPDEFWPLVVTVYMFINRDEIYTLINPIGVTYRIITPMRKG